MLSSVEQAFVGRDEKRAPLKMPAWEANQTWALKQIIKLHCFLSSLCNLVFKLYANSLIRKKLINFITHFVAGLSQIGDLHVSSVLADQKRMLVS